MFTLTYALNQNSKSQISLNTTYNQATDILIVRVSTSIVSSTYNYIHQLTFIHLNLIRFLNWNINDCLFQIKADTGYNSGFMFPASGAVQNDETVSSFGGVVYSASSDTLRIWTPVSPGPGYLLYISNEWGNTLYPQTSTTATLVVHVWKSTTCKYKGYNMSKKNKITNFCSY